MGEFCIIGHVCNHRDVKTNSTCGLKYPHMMFFITCLVIDLRLYTEENLKI